MQLKDSCAHFKTNASNLIIYYLLKEAMAAEESAKRRVKDRTR